MIKKLSILADGYVHCKSNFYTSTDVMNGKTIIFSTGVNKLVGDIDGGFWGISYIISMFDELKKNKDYFLESIITTVNDKEFSISELSKQSCYLDETLYPLFYSKRKTVVQLIAKGLKRSQMDTTVDEVCNLFKLDSQRIHRPIYQVGNERFRAMAAVGYAFGKQVFCFPWLSKKMFDYYTNNILWLLDIIETLNLVAIVPVGK